MGKFIVGTRKSKLAIEQTKQIIGSLNSFHRQTNFQLHEMDTFGDQHQDVPLYHFKERGIFTNEIEAGLVNHSIDLAVHSLKDLLVQDDRDSLFTIAAIPQREDVRDVFISRDGRKLSELDEGDLIGTSSLRRRAQVVHAYPHLRPKAIRGPINKRIEQVFQGDYDGIILAAAGIHRLQKQAYITEYLPIDTFTPAAGQGALAIQCRRQDKKLQGILHAVNDSKVARATAVERQFISSIDEANNGPVGVYAYDNGKEIQLLVRIVSLDGKDIIHFKLSNKSPEILVKEAVRLANQLGAKQLIQASVVGL